MTSDTSQTVSRPRHGRRNAARFVVAFLAGLLAVLALGAGALYAYDRQYEGRILPGVRVGPVDLSGLAPQTARSRLAGAYAAVGQGELVLVAGDRRTVVSYAELGRRIDVAGAVTQALAVGRSGGTLERVIGAPRTALRGADLEPALVFDAEAAASRVRAFAARLEREAKSASVAVSDEGFRLVEGVVGAKADPEGAIEEAVSALARLDAPATIEVEVPVTPIEPTITTAEAEAAMAAAERIVEPIEIQADDLTFTLDTPTLRTWLRLAETVDGRYVPVLDVTKAPAAVEGMAPEVKRSPKNASFKMGKNNKVAEVVASQDGRTLDVAATAALLNETLQARAEERSAGSITATVKVVEPALTTQEAEEAAPRIKRISRWTTYFPIGEKNGFGANIWIPAEDIDGYVVGPGETFDFWKAVGPVTRARGYRSGGAIINGRTEPQGALAGGICSTSTTLFNAALRAGFKMGARKNHYYYIDRYPLGLDATVFKSSSGSVQTMSWTNDTEYPVIVRGYGFREGGAGYVRFDLYSVPSGRDVAFSGARVWNVRKASDSEELTDTLPSGQRKRIESPVDGKEVSVTRVVRDADGNVIHRDTYYSNYARITGIVLVGR